MQKIITVAVVIVTFCFTTNAQTNASVTSAVTESFSNEFEGATDVQWEKISKDVFQVRFKNVDDNLLAYFDKDGALLKYGKKIPFEKAPLKVKNSLENLIKDFEHKNGHIFITHVYQIYEGSKVSYYTNMGNTNLFLAVLTNSSGRNSILRNVKLNLRTLDQQPSIVSRD
ncbi:MAG: hypothetical protein JSU09_05235 [Bacteroidetes bacterium]|nr:hypothetical protein [Bacteroidota bacterium]